MYNQVVESCDCVDEETECSDARVQGERIQQVLSVAGNASEEFAIGIITDTGESYQMLSLVTQFCTLSYECFQAASVICKSKYPPSWRRMSQLVDDYRLEHFM